MAGLDGSVANPDHLAAATPAEVIRAWDRLGYPRRALRLRDAAAVIRDNFGGQVPRTYDELLSLPGVGDYTAAAVAAFAFDERVVVLDTNVRRVLARVIFGLEHPATSSATKLERAVAQELLPSDGPRAAVWSVAIMELGRWSARHHRLPAICVPSGATARGLPPVGQPRCRGQNAPRSSRELIDRFAANSWQYFGQATTQLPRRHCAPVGPTTSSATAALIRWFPMASSNHCLAGAFASRTSVRNR